MSNLFLTNMDGLFRTLLSISPALLLFTPFTAVQSMAYALISLNVYNQLRERIIQIYLINTKIVEDYKSLKIILSRLANKSDKLSTKNSDLSSGKSQSLAYHKSSFWEGYINLAKIIFKDNELSIISQALKKAGDTVSRLKSTIKGDPGKGLGFHSPMANLHIDSLNDLISKSFTEMKIVKERLRLINSSINTGDISTQITEEKFIDSDHSKASTAPYKSIEIAKMDLEIKLKSIQKNHNLMQQEVKRRLYKSYYKNTFAIVDVKNNIKNHRVPAWHYLGRIIFNPTPLIAWAKHFSLIGWINFYFLGANYSKSGEINTNLSNLLVLGLSLSAIVFNSYFLFPGAFGRGVFAVLSKPANFLSVSAFLLVFRDFNFFPIAFRFVVRSAKLFLNSIRSTGIFIGTMIDKLMKLPLMAFGSAEVLLKLSVTKAIEAVPAAAKGFEAMTFLSLIIASVLTMGDLQLLFGLALNLSLTVRDLDSQEEDKAMPVSFFEKISAFIFPEGGVIENYTKLFDSSDNQFQTSLSLLSTVFMLKAGRFIIPKCPAVYVYSANLCRNILNKAIGVVSPAASQAVSSKISSIVRSY